MFEWSKHVAIRATAATWQSRQTGEPRPTITEAEIVSYGDLDSDDGDDDRYELIG